MYHVKFDMLFDLCKHCIQAINKSIFCIIIGDVIYMRIFITKSTKKKKKENVVTIK